MARRRGRNPVATSCITDRPKTVFKTKLPLMLLRLPNQHIHRSSRKQTGLATEPPSRAHIDVTGIRRIKGVLLGFVE